MKLFDIFNWRGEKIASVHEAGDPLDGIGCFASVFIAFVAIVGAFAVWPALYVTMRDSVRRGAENEIIQQLIYIFSILATSIGCIYFSVKEKGDFFSTWGITMGCITIIPGTIVWVAMCVMDGFTIKYLLMSLFISFLLSILCGFLVALISKIILLVLKIMSKTK